MEVCMEKWYMKAVSDVFGKMQSERKGLSREEAERRLETYGANELAEGQKKTLFRVFLEQFKDVLVIILILSAIVSALSGNLESTIVILVVIVLNAVLGTVQYSKAEKSLESLKSLSSPAARVLRDGVRVEVDSRELVPGDVLILEAGDMVVADGRIAANYSLQVNESSLTGESANVDKSDAVIGEEVALADRVNMVYSGSLVTYGRAEVLVTETGMETEIGRIARLMNDTREKKTPLQVSLDHFSNKLAIGILVISAAVFGLSLYRGMDILSSLMFAVALAVAAIPEALGSIVTIVQAMGTQKMARENAIIKNLKAVESLGCVSVICSDKTGTLTQNRMTVQDIYIGGQVIRPEQIDLRNQLHRYLLYDAILTNDSTLVDGKGIGDPTEYALLEMMDRVNPNRQQIRNMMQRLDEIPFDSDRKLMSTKYALHSVETILTKGAPDVLLNRTAKIRTNDGVRVFTPQDRDAILAQNEEFSKEGLRVLAFAYREPDEGEELTKESEKDFIFLGLVSMIDPPREESVQAVADAVRAGIRPVMITGDHKVTAAAIARQIGIFKEGDLAVTGQELDAMSEEELAGKIEKISVYARVSPENKIRIVEAWQKKGCIVSMTGDGVNDAPALKKADIGVAMGMTGTEVAKDAASMILSDDNFATIIKAVANGRNVYRNIKNAINFLLSGNLAGIFAVLYTSLLVLPVPFEPVHLLFINLLTDSLPALAIGMEPPEKDLLSDRPRDPSEGILTGDFIRSVFVQGFLIAAGTMSAYQMGMQTSPAAAATMAFSTLTLARLFHGFNCRSRHSIFHIGFRRNPYSAGAFFVGVLLLGIVLFVPFFQEVFQAVPLDGSQILAVAGLALAPTVLIQGYKVLRFDR